MDAPGAERYGVGMDDDHFHDQCGVFGVYGSEEAANLTYLGLHALQHRGQESAGIVASDGSRLFAHRALGLVQDVFSEELLQGLPGDRAIGHVRYSTAGASHVKNAQPIAVDYAHGSIALGHNGNLTNADDLRRQLEREGSIFSTTSDTEVLVHLIARSKGETTVDRVADALRQVRGAYSMVFLTPDELIAVRDPHGFRPLCLGGRQDMYLVASEPPAFELINGSYSRDIEPGEMVVINKFGLRSLRPFEDADRKMCIFEYVYFARPDAHLNGISVYDARKRLGRRLAKEQPADVDVVIPVPDSGLAAALGFAERMEVPFELGLIRSHYVGRTFIEPQQSIRHFGVRLKLHPVKNVLKDKRVAVIDDSIVRGTTSRKIVRMLREAGAREVHMRISSPPTRWPCFYGIDTPSRSELIASNHSAEDIARFIKADSIGYLTVEGLRKAVTGEGYCDACFSGKYPVEFEAPKTKGRRLGLVGI
ncbi:MAG: amidophosphoribosyltransferase [Myxococcota bacterium]